MKVTIDENLRGKELFDFLVTNKRLLIAEKKYNVKHADPINFPNLYITDKGAIVKANPITEDVDTIQRLCVINTTKWMDSHRDVHIDGLWKKSLAENKEVYLLQEHAMTFEKIITDEVEAYTKNINWRTLGVEIEGTTQALLFNSTIKRERNPFMFDQYKKGYVKNHSVGMRYIQIDMAINDKDYKVEFEIWNKYFDQIANKEEAENISYFFAVTEAKAIEGSAVPIGSNRITPVLDTDKQPPLGTDKQPLEGHFDIKQLLNIFQTS
jgi:hypothetical protein